jgi:DNA-binding transcriptional regulator YhcF (GntR family)
MSITIDATDERPMYRQIADQIKSLIASGELSEGQPLPSVRQLARDLNVNLNTIATAYRGLQDEGLIAIRHGFGASVASRRTQSTSTVDLRRMMRGVLTQMVLAGMPRGAIMETVAEELGELRKGRKR